MVCPDGKHGNRDQRRRPESRFVPPLALDVSFAILAATQICGPDSGLLGPFAGFPARPATGSVRRGQLDAVDDEHAHRAFLRIESQPELFANSREKVRLIVDAPCFRRTIEILQRHLVVA